MAQWQLGAVHTTRLAHLTDPAQVALRTTVDQHGVNGGLS